MARRLEHDWFDGVIPDCVVLGMDVYLDTAYGFALCDAREVGAVALGDACGAYDRANLVVGPRGRVSVGAYTCLNGVTLVCEGRIEIGAHCLLAWGAVLTDTWDPARVPASVRREALRRSSRDPLRRPPVVSEPRPVVLEENVWVGFDAVVLPGVRLGRGCVVGAKSVVWESVPPHTVVAGNPARPIRTLDGGDRGRESPSG